MAGTKETKFERGAFSMQLFMLRSHNFETPKSERGVNYTGLNQAYFYFVLPVPIQVGRGNRKKKLSLHFPKCILRLLLFLI